MVLPISCNECRRRKIRCNRINPCQNCTARSVECTYPSKFRSIDLSKLAQTNGHYNNVHEVPSQRPSMRNSGSPQMAQFIQVYPSSGSSPPMSPDRLSAAHRETLTKLEYTEQRLRELEMKLQVSEDLISIFDSSGTSMTNHFGSGSVQSLEYSLLGHTNNHKPLDTKKLPNGGDIGDGVFVGSSLKKGSQIKNVMVEKPKRSMPVLVPGSEEDNLKLVKQLVQKFFTTEDYRYFNEIFDEVEITSFVQNHKQIRHWDHDDDMMVLLAILIDSLKDGILHEERVVVKDTITTIKALVNYYFQISKTQPTETIKFIKSQLILINYFYYVFEFEKSWKMLFSTVSNAYSHGLHLLQGPVWMKLSFMEAVLCTASSRPNIIHGLTKLKVTQEEDPLREYEFMNIIRERNMACIENHVNHNDLKYQQVLQIDTRFENYNNFLTRLLQTVEPESILGSKIQFLLMFSLALQLKSHCHHFEKDRLSDLKTMELITAFVELLDKFCAPRLHFIRDIFTSWECHMYQVLLIFIMYMNFKSVNTMFKPDNNYEIKSAKDAELAKLQKCQDTILHVFDGNRHFKNKNILQAVEIIRSLDLSKLQTDTFIHAAEGNYYANDNIRSVLEDEDIYKALQDISGLHRQYVMETPYS